MSADFSNVSLGDEAKSPAPGAGILALDQTLVITSANVLAPQGKPSTLE